MNCVIGMSAGADPSVASTQIGQWIYAAAAVIAIVAGAMNCFFGYRIFKLLLAMWGFILGAGAGVALGMMGEALVWIIVGGILGGIAGIFLMLLLYYVVVFLLGGYVGMTAGVAISASLGIAPTWISAAAALAGGILAIIFQRTLIIIGTALTGAANVAWGIFSLADRMPELTQDIVTDQNALRQWIEANWDILLAWLAIAAAGIIVQHMLGDKKKPA